MDSATTLNGGVVSVVGHKRIRDEKEDDDLQVNGQVLKRDDLQMNGQVLKKWMDPVQGLASVRHEFGEHGGVNMSIEASTTFTVMEPETMGKLFEGKLGPDRDFYIYSRWEHTFILLHCSDSWVLMDSNVSGFFF